MNLYQLALKNIKINPFRSRAVTLCALPAARLALGTTIIMLIHTTLPAGYSTGAIRMPGEQTLDNQKKTVAPGRPGLP